MAASGVPQLFGGFIDRPALPVTPGSIFRLGRIFRHTIAAHRHRLAPEKTPRGNSAGLSYGPEILQRGLPNQGLSFTVESPRLRRHWRWDIRWTPRWDGALCVGAAPWFYTETLL